MINYIWLFFIISSIIIGGFNGKIAEVGTSMISSARLSVDIAISLVGIIAFWLGMMKIAQEAGLIDKIAKSIKPVTKRLFPNIPEDHPAIGTMAMNFSANALGLSNAATPIGIKAMKELQKINPIKDTASNAMCTFLAINTAGFQLVPATVIGILAATGSNNPTEIIGPTMISTSIALITAIIAVKLLEKVSKLPQGDEEC
ncbi:MAG: nucleoside recognition domain-containing protein [Candidatus Gastranaerophilales bacterium]|nr:nucleoside recognition domain-containing protein [Candidatus Gastranaerophilales bacterium]